MKGTTTILFVVICSAFSQLIEPGKCPEVQVFKNFNVSRYMGTWYEVRRYFNNYEAETICPNVSYTLESNGSVNVVGAAIKTDGKKTEVLGTGNFAKNGLGEFEVYILSNNSDVKFSILDTDYENYSSVYSCAEYPSNIHQNFAWVFTRSRDASKEVINEAKKAFDAQNITSSALQRGCPPTL